MNGHVQAPGTVDPSLLILLQDSTKAGIFIVGGPGSGKSYVIGHLARSLGVDHAVVLIRSVADASDEPYTAFVPLLGHSVVEAEVFDVVQNFQQYLESIKPPRSSTGLIPRPVVIVEESQQLDEASCFVLHQIALAGQATLVLTLTAGVKSRPGVESLFDSGLFGIKKLAPKNVAEMVSVAKEVLDGAATEITFDMLTRLSGGIPALSVAYLNDQVRNHSLARHGNVWALGPTNISAGGEVEQWTVGMLERFRPEEKEALRFLARHGTCLIADVEESCGASVTRLIDSGLVANREGFLHLSSELLRYSLSSQLSLVGKSSGPDAEDFADNGSKRDDEVHPWEVDSETGLRVLGALAKQGEHLRVRAWTEYLISSAERPEIAEAALLYAANALVEDGSSGEFLAQEIARITARELDTLGSSLPLVQAWQRYKSGDLVKDVLIILNAAGDPVPGEHEKLGERLHTELAATSTGCEPLYQSPRWQVIQAVSRALAGHEAEVRRAVAACLSEMDLTQPVVAAELDLVIGLLNLRSGRLSDAKIAFNSVMARKRVRESGIQLVAESISRWIDCQNDEFGSKNESATGPDRGFLTSLASLYALAADSYQDPSASSRVELRHLATRHQGLGEYVLAAEASVLLLRLEENLGVKGIDWPDGPWYSAADVVSREWNSTFVKALTEAGDNAARLGQIEWTIYALARAVRHPDMVDQPRSKGRVVRRLMALRDLLGPQLLPEIKEAIDLGRLTEREQEIAALVAEGISNQEIARKLTLSRRTVEGHLYRIYSKLGIDDRSQLENFNEGVREI